MSNPGERREEAQSLLKNSLVVNCSESVYPNEPKTMFSDEYLNKLASVGVSCVVVTTAWKPEHDFRTTVNRIIDTYSILGGGRMMYGESVESILEAQRNGKLAVVLQFQNTLPIEHDTRLLEVFYKLGVRVVQLTYSERNLVGDGCNEKTDCGLSDLGRKVVYEMNRIGLVIDLSHVGYTSSLEAIEQSKDPVIFSHSNSRALCDVPRNLRDDQIKAVAQKDGVIGIGAPSFIVKTNFEKDPPTVKHLVDHVDYMVKLIGADHVGIGLDYTEGRGRPQFAIDSVAQMVDITDDLLGRGYSQSDVKKIMGENFLRVFRRVWKKY